VNLNHRFDHYRRNHHRLDGHSNRYRNCYGNHQRITGLFFQDRQLKLVQGSRFRLDDFIEDQNRFRHVLGGVLEQGVQVGLQRQLRPGLEINGTVHLYAHAQAPSTLYSEVIGL